MPNLLARASLFLSAYAPLLILFAILNSFGRTWASWTCAGLATVGLVMLAVFWRAAQSIQPEQFDVVRITRRDEDVLAFFVTYVVPFAVAPLDSSRVAVALVVFLVLIGLLYLRAGMYRVHPILLLAGYHLYELETKDESQSSIACLSRSEYLERGLIEVRNVAPGIFVRTEVKA